MFAESLLVSLVHTSVIVEGFKIYKKSSSLVQFIFYAVELKTSNTKSLELC